ncbi:MULTISPECIES: TadE/TadG family type IV pilus assembly protein [Pseudarthrobacter]|uniref:Flp pilus assembly protein TadG n=1 Tax=Pseudarthrobacter niigatensis TaxID=369935 RepID=A0AAJ1T084_9MICC|nr:TadE family protein [Pseudarthrobacter niigatensis]MDQ0147906.1 Flp pilus assembly protein TadG [Pseudarthrobacter niigatensis]MDQ0268012.1 Flp pilus assembly protein TadG [Pseudarthrobacter niigatensis]NUT69820.1 pilus assembly protein [Pseudarthrobacter sp. C4D7]
MKRDSERGAAAVEFAILLPLLLMLVLGTIEFGRAYNAQITLTNAARDGVRVMAINNDPTAAKKAAQNAAASVSSTIPVSDITLSSTTCSTGNQITLTIKYTLSTITGIAGPFPMTGKGVMLCGG